MNTKTRHIAGTAPQYRLETVLCTKANDDCTKKRVYTVGAEHYHKVRVEQS